MRAVYVLLLLLSVSACSDALEQTTSAGQVVVAVNTVSGTLSLVSVADRTVSSLPVPPTGSTPQQLAVLGSRLAVPAGDSAALALLDFSNGTPPTIATRRLSGGSGPGGVAFQDDSIAWVANPSQNSVTRVNLDSGDTTRVATGASPHAVVVDGGFLYVMNANVDPGGVPAGPSWITVLPTRAGAPPPVDSIPLTGTNARNATIGADGLLYVVEAGTPGKADGRLSIVDPAVGVELVVVNGLGESPGIAVYHPSGRLLIASLAAGILEVNTATRTLLRGPSNGVVPQGASGVAAIALDQAGRVYAFDQGDCSGPGVVHILSPPPEYDDLRQIPVGVCPSAAATILVP